VLDLVKNIIAGLDPHSAAVLDKYVMPCHLTLRTRTHSLSVC
jgi:hypothetical protein